MDNIQSNSSIQFQNMVDKIENLEYLKMMKDIIQLRINMIMHFDSTNTVKRPSFVFSDQNSYLDTK